MRAINHAHLLKTIAAFTRGQQCGFIMPRASGSLRTFWETQDPSTLGYERMISWLFTQLLGITEGLAKLHEHYDGDEMSTRHGALTPDNILWFPGHEADPSTRFLGILIIGDGGQTKGRIKRTGTDRGAEVRYTARDRPKSPIDDIWSLGLIFFEFVIWLIRGNREVQNFRSQTSHVYLSEEEDYKFEEWVSLLIKDDRCLPATPLGKLIQFIVRKALVPRDNRYQYDQHRATASEFHSLVSEVHSAVL